MNIRLRAPQLTAGNHILGKWEILSCYGGAAAILVGLSLGSLIHHLTFGFIIAAIGCVSLAASVLYTGIRYGFGPTDEEQGIPVTFSPEARARFNRVKQVRGITSDRDLIREAMKMYEDETLKMDVGGV